MPRIDPERLLKCLQPLLEPKTGAIKSVDEVDKILGLMSKFSKKLVSKCIYINILRASDRGVVDLFMQRGGWKLVFDWTDEAVTTKNFSLLREVLQLLLITPTNVPRLRENKFPMIVKGLSKDCEDEGTKNLAKEVVARWISIAKGEEEPQQIQSIDSHVAPLAMTIEQNNVVPHELANLHMNSADSLLNIDPTFIPDTDTGNAIMDLGISTTDLVGIDFNMDIFSKVIEQPSMDVGLTEASVANNHIVGQSAVDAVQMQTNKTELAPNLVMSNANTLPLVNTNTITQMQQQQTMKPEVIEMVQVPPTPKLYIKTIGGQKTVVQNPQPEAGQYCMFVKDGKNYLVKIDPSSVTPTLTAQSVQIAESSIATLKTEECPKNSSKEKKNKLSKKDSKVLSSSKTVGQNEIKTYSKSKPVVNKDSSTNHKKSSSDQNVKPEKDKDKKSKDKSSSSDSHRKSKSSSSRSKAETTAALEAKQAADKKLRDEIYKQKQLMKKRAKDMEKQKQQEKDQETLKKLNLAPPSATSPSSAMKIPKIPKKNTSFIDAIGIPGSDGVSSVDKIKKVSSSTSKVDESIPTSPCKKSPTLKKEESETESTDKPKERRHKVKVFISTKSRIDDLLNEQTETGKSKTSKDKGKDDNKPSQSLGNSIIAAPPPKATKRLSTESIEKPGETKKAKLNDKGDKKDTATSKEPEKSKKPIKALTESPLFMDMLNASSETTKPLKRKRRVSVSGEKEAISPIEKLIRQQNSFEKEENDNASPTIQETIMEEHIQKPVFNFYVDTLNDNANEDNENKELGTPKDSEKAHMDHVGSSFIPQEGDGKLKSALCLVRSRNRPRKSVRWREEDELREFHFFEMDETERVNVTKQQNSFSELSQNEKANERQFVRLKAEEEEQEQKQWRLIKIAFKPDHLQPTITSQERFVQEDRERNVLGLFLPPGAPLPDTPSEPEDPSSPVDRTESKFIPVEDVNGITKVCDFRTHLWPAPKLSLLGNPVGFNAVPNDTDNSHNAHLNAFPPPNDFNNPWNNSSANTGFGVPPPTVASNIPDMSTFQTFPPPVGFGMNMNFLQTAPPTANIGFPPPTLTPNPFAMPPPQTQHINGGPSFTNNGRDGRMQNSNRGGRFNDSDQRRNFHGGRDREGGSRDRGAGRDRDYRDDRGGRDRDFRRRDKDSDREYRHYDRDNRDRNNRDFRSGSSGRNNRKDIPCRYFKNGFCSSGNKCQFLHDGSNNHDDIRGNSRPDSHDSGKSRRSPDSRDIDFRQSSAADEDWEDDSSHSRVNNTVNNSDEARFALPPSSPTEPEMPVFASNAESTKVIPV